MSSGSPHNTTGLTREERDARWEDVQWMLSTGETMDGAAKRIGISTGALYKWLAKEREQRELVA